MLHAYRPLQKSDVSFFYSWIRDEEVIRYSLTKFHTMKTDNEIDEWFAGMLSDSKNFSLGIIDQKTEKLIGYAGISAINRIDNNGEYFIFIGDRSYWGKGIGSKTTLDIVRHGFDKLKLHRIFLTASSLNKNALKAYKKAGFFDEGLMKDAFFRGGQYSDKVIMGLLAND